jgi:hypothetical protein
MERRALVLTLALTLPLGLYGIPYAYAATFSSTYVVSAHGTFDFADVHCSTGDYATGGGGAATNPAALVLNLPEKYNGVTYSTAYSGLPNAWGASSTGTPAGVYVFVACQTPIAVAGIGVPQFGSLYFAVALGAVVYFMLARRFAKRQTISPAFTPAA